MMRIARIMLAITGLLVTAACGGDSGMGPTPPPPPPPPVNNNAPVIESLSVRMSRAGAPADFVNVSDSVELTASVRDDETAPASLTYNWSAPLGTFSGSGATVNWQAPASAESPSDVTLTLQIVERYGNNQEHRVTRTAQVRLHDTAREVGNMSRTFLDRFSQPQTIKDWKIVMADFNAAACPDPGEVDSERADVERHYNNFFMHNYTVGPAQVNVGFGGLCGVPNRNPIRGDACAIVPVMWDSTDLRDNRRAVTAGTDYLSAAYSRTDRRWYLCASQFVGANTFGHAFYSR